MALRPLLSSLHNEPAFQRVLEGLRQDLGRLRVVAPDAATSYVVAGLWHALGAPVLLVTPQPEQARRLTDQLTTWIGEDEEVQQFAEVETLPFERLSPDRYAVHQRLRALAALLEADGIATHSPGDADGSASSERERSGQTVPIIVASIAAASRTVLARSAFESATHTLRVGDEAPIDDLVQRWVSMGYEFKAAVEGPGMASRRGGILDVYPPSLDTPVRIEFFGDEIESIRAFEPESQRSTDKLSAVTVIPADDTVPGLADQHRVSELVGQLDFSNTGSAVEQRVFEELSAIQAGRHVDGVPFYAGFVSHGSLFDYLPDQCVVVALRPTEMEETARHSDDRLDSLREVKASRGEIPASFPPAHLDWGLVADGMWRGRRSVQLSPWGPGEDMPGGAPHLPFRPPPAAGGDVDHLWEQLPDLRGAGASIAILSQHAGRLVDLAREAGVQVEQATEITREPPPGSVTIVPGHLRHGFHWAPESGSQLVVLTDTEVFGVTKERRPVRRKKARRAARLQDLNPGAYLVHIEHGIGRFLGTKTLDGQEGREYLELQYANDDKLYVPLEQLDRLSPYHGAGDAPPKLTRLGTQEWTKAKERARRATEQLAGELIALYAARKSAPGYESVADTPWQDQLEASFPYEETPDQLSSLADVKADLEADRPMDRLVCGDVGYGKTEVALRAAFKVIQSGRQVAVLVPTTVLAQQHYETFTERLSGFPVRVAPLSRLVSDEEQRRAVKGLASGEIDIVIGTHRLLQRDVRFKNLGLLVIDEEHRFGVLHKERLKRMRSEIDVLTMSATPIPRTLHISLAGIRDMSTIDTPPEDRLPIKTYVSEESQELIREAILRELDRGGQVFFVHNRVRNIEYVAQELEKLVPEARFVVGHGQMPEGQLESVMTGYAQGGYDVLVCSTIIESGLDLPNVNTMIVDRSDRFGLSQLYQLRGRIGRGSRRAYAYFLLPRGKRLTETAEQRLNTIAAATELGAGYQIAMRDLEIRGAGNILGAEQSGQIAAVGFDLYTKLLAEAVEQLKAGSNGTSPPGSERGPEFSLVNIDLGLEARIPYTYVEDLAERLSIYQRIARITDLDSVDDVEDELRDRFGPTPKPAKLLLQTVRARVLAERANASGVTASGDRVTISLNDPTGGARQALQRRLGRGVTAGHMQVRMEIDREEDEWIEELLWTLNEIRKFREEMLERLERAGVLAGS